MRFSLIDRISDSHGVSVNTRQVFYELAKKHKEISLPPHVVSSIDLQGY